MANPFGRTTGTKNRPGHNAGKRKGAGRPAKLNDDEKRSKAASDEKKKMAFLQQQEENKKKKDAERARNEETRQARLTQMHAKCVDALRRFGLAADKGDCDGDAEGGDDDGVNADDQADDYMCSDADVEKTKDCNLKSRRKYQRSSYIPPRNSVLWKKMEMFKETVKDRSISNSSKDKHLWRDNNQADPVAAFNKNPDEFYLSNFHPFVGQSVELLERTMINRASLQSVWLFRIIMML